MSTETTAPTVNDEAEPTVVVVHEVVEPVLVVEQEIIVLSDDDAAAAPTDEHEVKHAAGGEHAHKEKSPSFHLLPNSETFHKVKDPLVLHRDKESAHGEEGHVHVDGDDVASEKSPSFHRLPNKESFHVVKDPLKVK